MNRTVYDTVRETVGHRMSVHKDHKNGVAVVPYSSGHEVTWEKTAEGDGTRLKEVRTLTKIKNPVTLFSIAPEAWDRIFGPKKEEGE